MYRYTGKEQSVVVKPKAAPVMVRRQLPEKLERILNGVCERHDVTDFDVLGKSRLKRIVQARREMIAIMYFKLGYDHYRIAHLLQMDRTSVLHHLGMRKKSTVKYPHLRIMYQ